MQVITACTVLHNICLDAGDVLDSNDDDNEDEDNDEDDEEENEDEGQRVLEAVSGDLWRHQLTAEVSGLEVPMDHEL